MTSRRLSRLRALLRSTVCVLAVVGCALGATGCDPSTSSDAQSEAPSIESGPADLVDSSGSDNAGWTTGLALFSDTPWLIATASGPVAILRIRSEEYSGPNDKTVLAALDPQDGSLRWSLTITPAIESLESSPSRNQSIPQRATIDNINLVGSPGPVVTSPNGQYISLQLNSNESSTIAGTRAGILVLDAATGETVRTLETTGLVLGQALTDSDLFVQTAQDYVPAGSGTLTVARLDEPEAEPSTLRTDQWLVGATADAVLLAPDGLSGFCPPCTSATITEMSASGETLATIPYVYRILSAGRVERYTDPAAANDAVGGPGKDLAWAATSREILNVSTGTTTDITGFATAPAPLILTDGPGVLLNRVVEAEPDKDGSPRFDQHSAAWIGAPADGGAVHTEPVTDVKDRYRTSKFVKPEDHMDVTLSPTPMEAP